MHKLLLMHCGGTLGMVPSPNGFKTRPGTLRKIILSNPNITSKVFPMDRMKSKNPKRPREELMIFSTPLLRNGIRAMIYMVEFQDIIDSSNASVEEFCAIAKALAHFYDYDDYDGFVIIHGTDTMAYAASFLTFMLEGLMVPVVFTGSLLPMAAKGSDGERNLIGAIESCLMVDAPGVYLYFNGWLHLGVRTTKISSESFDNFYSTNPVSIEDLAKQNNGSIPKRHRRADSLYLYTRLSSDVGIFKVFPSIHPRHLKATLSSYKAVILETYGSGTFPSNREDLLQVIEDYIAEGGVVVSVSQCADGNAKDIYETSSVLSRLGVLSAKNMTTECAFAKLSLLVANHSKEIEKWFQVSFCGEIDESANTKFFSFNNCRLCTTV